jgi:HD-GYP domain-containing protein (c-di-GMP phosphodiesterase class II)
MQMGMAQRETGVYVLAGLAHDIGKLGTPDRVLKKPGRLTQDEFLIMKAHASHSAQLLHRLSASDELSLAVRHHHERIDGFGYPDGLKGDQVPIGARIILVADTYDAMTSDRSYRRGCGPAIAFDELRNCSGSQFDGAVVEAFIKGMQELQKDELHLIEDFVERICKS